MKQYLERMSKIQLSNRREEIEMSPRDTLNLQRSFQEEGSREEAFNPYLSDEMSDRRDFNVPFRDDHELMMYEKARVEPSLTMQILSGTGSSVQEERYPRNISRLAPEEHFDEYTETPVSMIRRGRPSSKKVDWDLEPLHDPFLRREEEPDELFFVPPNQNFAPQWYDRPYMPSSRGQYRDDRSFDQMPFGQEYFEPPPFELFEPRPELRREEEPTWAPVYQTSSRRRPQYPDFPRHEARQVSETFIPDRRTRERETGSKTERLSSQSKPSPPKRRHEALSASGKSNPTQIAAKKPLLSTKQSDLKPGAPRRGLALYQAAKSKTTTDP